MVITNDIKGDSRKEKAAISGEMKRLKYVNMNIFFLLSVLSIIIWGFQPVIFDRHIINISQDSPELFVALRYSLSAMIFLIPLIFLRKYVGPRYQARGQSSGRKDTFSIIIAASSMGLFMYMSRLFEIFSYGPKDNSVLSTFGMIFSIFFVILWNWKGWLIRILFGESRLPIINKLSRDLPNMQEFWSWVVQCALVISAGLFFVYAEIGVLPTHGDGLQSLFWALGSSFFLSLYYDIAIKPIKSDSVTTYSFELLKVFAISAIFTGFVAIIHWLLNHGFALEMISDLLNEIISLPTYSFLKYTVGYVFAITCFAYYIESLGLSLYEIRNTKRNIVSGREWASIFATLDPFVAVLVAYIFLANGHIQAAPYYALSALLVFCVGVQSFQCLWSRELASKSSIAVAYTS